MIKMTKTTSKLNETQLDKWLWKQATTVTKGSKTDILKTVEIKDGNFTCTDSHRLVRINDFDPETTYQLIDPKNGNDVTSDPSIPSYPGTDRLIRDFSETTINIPVKEFYNMVSAINGDYKRATRNTGSSTKAMKINFNNDSITFTPDNCHDYQLKEAVLSIDSENYPDINFAINNSYLTDAFLFFKRLKIENITMEYNGPLRPIQFRYDNLVYLITPIRSY